MFKKFTLTFIALFLINFPLMAGVYKWTDASGKIHFSDKSHKDAAEININAPKSTGVGVTKNQLKRQKELLQGYQNKRIGKRQERERSDRRDAKKLKLCKRLKNAILDFKEVDYLYLRDNDGQKKYLDSSDKKKKIAKFQKEYKDKCS